MMKFIFSISLNFILLLVFTTTPATSMWACGKDKCKKEVAHTKSTCEKECCKKPPSDSKKKNCCGGDCSCSVSIAFSADLPKQLPLDTWLSRPVFVLKTVFSYKEAFSKSTIQDIWQPPITSLSI